MVGKGGMGRTGRAGRKEVWGGERARGEPLPLGGDLGGKRARRRLCPVAPVLGMERLGERRKHWGSEGVEN